MADVDILPSRGIRAAALVDGNGIAINGTSTIAQLASRGMRSICEVTPLGVAANGATLLQLAQRGIRNFCPVSELGVATDASTADTLQRRGIKPMVPVSALGVALTGSATTPTLAQRGLDYFCPLNESGGATTLIDPTPLTLHALTGAFALGGETMETVTGYMLTASAGAFSVPANSATNLIPPTPAEDPATTAWAAAVVAAGGTVSTTRKGIVNTFIVALKAAGVWTLLDRYWLFAGENTQSALRDMVNLQVATSTGSPTFAANVGYTVASNFDAVDTGFVPSAGGSNYLLNSASAGMVVQTNRTTFPTNGVNFGAADGSFANVLTFAALDSTGVARVRVNSGPGATDTGTGATTRGSWLASRTGGSAGAVYLNGASSFAITQSVSALPNVSIMLGALNQGGSAAAFIADQFSSFHVGAGLDSTQAAAFEAAQNAMMTSIGINVH